MEAQIYPLAINLDGPNAIFNRLFFYDTPNRLTERINCDESYSHAIRLIDVADYRPGHHLELAMDDEAGQAVAYFSSDERQPL